MCRSATPTQPRSPSRSSPAPPTAPRVPGLRYLRGQGPPPLSATRTLSGPVPLRWSGRRLSWPRPATTRTATALTTFTAETRSENQTHLTRSSSHRSKLVKPLHSPAKLSTYLAEVTAIWFRRQLRIFGTMSLTCAPHFGRRRKRPEIRNSLLFGTLMRGRREAVPSKPMHGHPPVALSSKSRPARPLRAFHDWTCHTCALTEHHLVDD
jgi:hypothetical protein